MSGLHTVQGVTEGVHIPYQWSFANAAARVVVTDYRTGVGYQAKDLGKFARQTDDNSIWMLTATTPTWQSVGGGSGGTTPTAIQGNIMVGDATPAWAALDASTDGAILVGNGTTLTSVTSPLFVGLSNNRVGIGTTSPSYLLHLQKSGTPRLLVEETLNTGRAVIQVQSASSSNYFQFSAWGSAATSTSAGVARADLGEINFGNNSNALINQGSPNALIFATASTERMRIDASGNVGIGTTSPAHNLTVNESSDDGYPTLGVASGKFGIFRSDAYGMQMGIDSSGNTWIQNQRIDATATAYNLVLQPSGGNVGIGDTSPSKRLTIGGADQDIMFSSDGSEHDIQFDSSAYTRIIGKGSSSVAADNFIKFRTNSGLRGTFDEGGTFFIGTSSTNSFMTVGLTINQAANDDEALALQSTDVNHPYTSLADNESFATFKKYYGPTGGVKLTGYTNNSTSGRTAVTLQADVGYTSLETSTANATVGAIHLRTYVNSSGSEAAPTTTQAILTVAAGTTTRYIFKADGTAYADVAWSTFSDSRLKTEQELIDSDHALSIVRSLKPKTYLRHRGSVINGVVSYDTTEAAFRSAGLISQEIIELIPEAVPKNDDPDNAFYGINEGPVVAYLIAAVQAQQEKIEELEARL